jgi:hypothetical protein
MRRLALFVALAACGGGHRVGEDLDTETRTAPPARRCKHNCQSVDWVDREVMAALADIAVCLDQPAYAPPGLRGNLTVAFRDVPCEQAVAQVAAAAGLSMVVSTVAGRPAVLLRVDNRPGQKLVLLPRGDGWQPGGGRGGGGGGRSGTSTTCLDGCAVEVRSCKRSCDWSDSTCVRACEDRYRQCNSSC